MLKYDKLGAKCNDLLSDQFPAENKFTVKLKNKFDGGFEIDTTLDRSMDNKESVDVVVKPSYRCSSGFLNLKIKSKFRSNQQNKVSAKITNFLTPGTSLRAGTKLEKDKEKAEGRTHFGIARYKNEFVDVRGTVEYPTNGDPLDLSVIAVAQFPPKVYWGINAIKPRLGNKYFRSGKIHFDCDSFAATVFFDNEDTSQLGLGWHQRIDENTEVATRFNLPETWKQSPSLVAAMSKKVDEKNTVKTKLSVYDNKDKFKEFRIGLSYSSQISNSFSCTVGADINARSLVGAKGGNPNSIGFEINLI